jgi:hypothetical protein
MMPGYLLTIVASLLFFGQAQGQQRFLIGYSSFSSNQIPLWVAKEEGLFKCFGADLCGRDR